MTGQVRRVLMTADAVGGVWTYALELADALAPHGVEVSLVVMGSRLSPAQREQVEASAVAGVVDTGLALEWQDDPWGDVDRAGKLLLELEEQLQPDVVHLNGYALGALPWRAPCVVVAHSDVLSWWDAVRREPAPPVWDRYRERVGQGLRGADVVVAPTAAALRDLQRWWDVADGRVIPNCRRADWVTGLPKEPFVLAAGRMWDEAKNLGALAAVAPDLPWDVVVAGAGGAAPGVRSLGRLPFAELGQWMERAAVFAAPAAYEPFGLGPLEAAHAGCALVLGDLPSLREVWDDAALYVDPHDPSALRAALVELAGQADRVHDLGARARARAAEYLPARTAQAYVELYEQVVTTAGVTA